jgi:hypothetical protein
MLGLSLLGSAVTGVKSHALRQQCSGRCSITNIICSCLVMIPFSWVPGGLQVVLWRGSSLLHCLPECGLLLVAASSNSGVVLVGRPASWW